eukprot:EG_transcript_19159
MAQPTQGLAKWLETCGPVTRGTILVSGMLTVLATAGVVPPYLLVLHWPSVLQHGQIWRPFTSLVFVGAVGNNNAFTTVMNYYMLASFSRTVEDEVFHRRLEDHLLFGLTAAALLWAAAAYLEALFLAPAFTMALVWLVCQRSPCMYHVLGFSIPSKYFPFALIKVSYLLGGSPTLYIMGIVASYLYITLKYDLGVLPTPRAFSGAETPESPPPASTTESKSGSEPGNATADATRRSD